jgi:hypothetical protein
MNKEFIPYEQALELKDLGFNEKCLTSYNPKKELVGVFDTALQNDDVKVEDCFVFNSKIHTTFVAAPLYQQAFRWFREKYELVSWVSLGSQNSREYIFGILTDSTFIGSYNTNFSTYEEAELACLKKLIEIVKNK